MCRLFCLTIATLMVVFGITSLIIMPKLIQQKIEQRIQLKIGDKKVYNRFTTIPIPLTVKFYIFNVTNSEQVLAGLERPKFEEVGPFMYKQWRRRDVVDFEDNNRRIRYREIKTFIPMFNNNNNTTTNEHNSNQSDANLLLNPNSVNVTIINLPLLSVLTKLAQLEEGTLKRNLASKVASRLISDGRDKILVTRPANEVLFDGYKVDFMESARDLISGTLGFNFESPLPGNKFGFFYMKNGTWSRKENGELTVFTGRNGSMNDFMLVDNWNDQKQLNVWPNNTSAGDKCNQIKGTDGSQFQPGVTRDSQLAIFSPLICRSLFIKFKEETQTKNIPLLRFGTSPELFAAPRKRAENACFCTITATKHQKSNSGKNNNSQIDDSRCYLDGLMDLSLCQRGAPVAASSPHFYNADPMLAMAAGLKPNKEIHETFLDIEPMTGSVFRAASRAQLNAFVERAALEVVDSSIIGNMTAMVAPLLWLEERGEIDEKSSLEFKNQLLNTVTKAKRTFRYFIVIGALIAVVVGLQWWYVTCYSINSSREKKPKKGGAERRRRNNRKGEVAGKRLRENIRLGGGARSSNLAAKLVDSRQEGAGKSNVPVVAVAAVLGAVAGPSGRSKRSRAAPATPRMGGKHSEEDELIEVPWGSSELTTSSDGHSPDGAIETVHNEAYDCDF